MRLVLVVLALALGARALDFFDAKCSACLAVVDEIQRNTAKQDKMEHMDMQLGGRIDSKGRRQGKKIDYQVSEIRAFEILETVCAPMKDYTLVTNKGRAYFQKINDNDGEGGGSFTVSGSMSIGGPQSGEDGRRLKVYCEALVEDNEDALTESLTGGEGELRNKLCVETVGICSAEDVEFIGAELGVGARAPKTAPGASAGKQDAPKKKKKKKAPKKKVDL